MPFPLDPEDMNDQRAIAASKTLQYFTHHHGEDLPNVLGQNIADLLCNLAHFCDRRNVSLTDCLAQAKNNYGPETDNTGTQFNAMVIPTRTRIGNTPTCNDCDMPDDRCVCEDQPLS